VLLSILACQARAQTTCGIRHSDAGVFVCYPNPAENDGDSAVPDILHLSAQANAPDGQTIGRYSVLIDNRLIYENRIAVPAQRLSIETNVKSPFDSGSHTLKLVVDRAGSAEVKELRLYPSKYASFCDPFDRFDKRACNPSNIRGPLLWSIRGSIKASASGKTAAFPDGYLAYRNIYGQNLKSMEADVADAIAVDGQGNLFAASHAFADVELRKYSPGGSIVYDSLIRSCGDGFVSVTGMALGRTGRVWIAGNTSACLSATPNAYQPRVSKANRTRGFVMLLDTAQSGSTAPLFVTYLADADARISAIRVDDEGNVYVAGTTASPEFPHESSLNVDEDAVSSRTTKFGFVSVLNPSGSGMEWSALLPNARLNALALDGNNIYVTGRIGSASNHGFVAGISDRGRRLSYLSRFGGSGEDEGRAIAVSARGEWVFVTGETNALHSGALASRSFWLALEPCRTGHFYFGLISEADSPPLPEVVSTPALDAFAAIVRGTLSGIAPAGTQNSGVSLKIAPACDSIEP
jgi:hypothetical protein